LLALTKPPPIIRIMTGPHPTPHIQHSSKQPPSGGYAAVSPKGGGFKAGHQTKRSAYHALGSGFQLAQAPGLLGWNDEKG